MWVSEMRGAEDRDKIAQVDMRASSLRKSCAKCTPRRLGPGTAETEEGEKTRGEDFRQ